jgi:hypothetical protein
MDGAQQMGSMVLYHGNILDHKRFFSDPIARLREKEETFVEKEETFVEKGNEKFSKVGLCPSVEFWIL